MKQMIMNDLRLHTIIFLEGFVTISLEILTIRQLIPVVGNSVIVTSLIIGVFLLFLAYGYRKGGLYIENYPRRLVNNFTLAAIGLGIGLATVFVEQFFYIVGNVVNHNVLAPLIIYLLLVTAPLVYWLGQTVPITFNLFQAKQRAGALGGRILHISTLGSFLGAVITSVLFMNYLGVAWTIFINFMVLLVLVLLLINVKQDFIRLVALIAFGCVIYGLNIKLEKHFYLLTDSYNNYQVININTLADNNPTGRVLVINNSPSSYTNDKQQAFPYIEAIRKILFNDLHLTNKNILVLGAGGFTLSAGQDGGNHFTYVDIDKKIAPVVQQNFLKHINGAFVNADARLFLSSSPKLYDVVVADVYSNEYAIPAHLLTAEYFTAIKEALAANGIVIFNIIATPTFMDSYSKHVDNTIRAVFANCVAMPLSYVERPTNIIYVCKKATNENDKMVYGDNLNRATLEYFRD